jgi:hypothetical protein
MDSRLRGNDGGRGHDGENAGMTGARANDDQLRLRRMSDWVLPFPRFHHRMVSPFTQQVTPCQAHLKNHAHPLLR